MTDYYANLLANIQNDGFLGKTKITTTTDFIDRGRVSTAKGEDICNICGKKICGDESVFGYLHLVYNVGYGSAHDGEKIDLTACNGCLDRLIECCQVSPVVD